MQESLDRSAAAGVLKNKEQLTAGRQHQRKNKAEVLVNN